LDDDPTAKQSFATTLQKISLPLQGGCIREMFLQVGGVIRIKNPDLIQAKRIMPNYKLCDSDFFDKFGPQPFKLPVQNNSAGLKK